MGLVSRSMIVPISHRQDTAGPITRTVRDAAILLGILSGVDANDPITQESGGRSYADYTQFLDSDGLKGARIGVAAGAKGNVRLQEAVSVIKSRGAILVDPLNLNFPDLREGDMLEFDFKAELNAFLESMGPNAPVHSLQEVIAYNNQHKKEELSLFGQDILTRSQARGPLTGADYQKLLQNWTRGKSEALDTAFDKYQLDAIIGLDSSPAAIAGYPLLAIPAGFLSGRAVSLTFCGRAYSEPTLLKLAYAFEQATLLRRPPQFYPHLGDSDLNKANQALRSAIGKTSLTPSQQAALDADQDGDVDLSDVRLWVKKALGI